MLTIPPIELRDFLKSIGWTVVQEAYKDRLYVLQNQLFPRRQMVFPMDSDAPDYLEASESTVAKVADLLKENPEVIREKALSTKDDVVRVRIDWARGNQESDSLPLLFASSLVSGAQKLLRSAACTVIKPRSHHPRLTLTDAVNLVEKCSFGHTEPGSYVVKVSCPIQALDVQGELDFGDQSDTPFVRKVMLALYGGVDELIDAIEEDKLQDLVDRTKQGSSPLLSSNFCEAITQLQDESLNNSVDLSVDWSLLYPVSERYRQKKRLRIQRDYFPRIEEVRRELRFTEKAQEDSFIGTVERLDGEMTESGRRSGEVVLALLVEGESVRTRTSLDPDDYEKADRAHMTDGSSVQVTGRLRPGRQPRLLTNVSAFELVGGRIPQLPKD